MSLIDVASEDDLLIDSQLDRASFDLRLSIAYDADEHIRVSNVGKKDEFKSRQSLAWDKAFFTSAGILDLRELSLVNDGFKNPEDQRSKICEKRRLKCNVARGEASQSFIDFRVSGKHNLQCSKHNTREPKTNISLASQTRMKYGQVNPQMKTVNQQSTRSAEKSSAQKQDRHIRPPKAQTRASVHLASAVKSPRSANTSIVSSSGGKRWLSKSLDLRGGKLVSIDCNVAQVSDKEGNKAPRAKAKRSLSPLSGDVMSSTKKSSRLCMSSERLGLKKGQKTRPIDKDNEKENMFRVGRGSFHGGKEKYVEITDLFDGLTIDSKGIDPKKTSTSRLVASAPTLRPKTKQSNRVMDARDSALTRSAFISRV